jgi:hypothetical protein
MYTYLTKSEIQKYSAEIKLEFDRLVGASWMRIDPADKQWRFFRHNVNVLLGLDGPPFEFDANVTELRRAVMNKLHDYYERRPNPPLRFQFRFVQDRHRERLFGRRSAYACSHGYMLLVLPTEPRLNTELQTRAARIRVVDNAIHAAYDAFAALPSREESEGRIPPKIFNDLAEHYARDGEAYAVVEGILRRHFERGEVLDVPSTRPWLEEKEITVRQVSDGKAVVKTREFWNLHWRSWKHKVFVSWYQGYDSQTYTLVERDGRWLVDGRESYSAPQGLRAGRGRRGGRRRAAPPPRPGDAA